MVTQAIKDYIMTAVRNSAKAIIVRDDHLLVIKNLDPDGDWYILPGGGQKHGESLHEALKRECLEEIAAEIEIGRLILIREYIGKNHEFAKYDSHVHQVEFMFECRIQENYSPGNGNTPDAYQTGVVWLALKDLEQYRVYPSILKSILKNGSAVESPVYLGDVN